MTKLARTLQFRDLLLLVIGAVIGSGIFLVPGAILRQVDGSVGIALLVWIVGGILSLLGALTYGEMTAMNPEAGGLYIFIRDTFGRLPSFLYGWTLFFVIASGAMATLSVAFSKYLGEIIPLSPLAAKLVSVAMIVTVTLINVRGARRSADVQNTATLIKVGALLLMSAALLILGRNYHAASAAFWPAEITGHLISKAGLSMIGVLWAYEAWQFATFSAGESINPQRNYPRAFLAGMLFLIGIYLFANFAYIVALGPQVAAATDTIAHTAVATVISPALANIVSLAIMISAFSAANSIQLTAPRVFYAMARDGVFFRKLAEVHPRFHTPAIAILVSGAWACVLAVNATFQQLYTYVIFAGWVFYGMAAASVIVYRQRMPDAVRPYRVPGYPWTPLVFVLASIALIVNTLYSTPKDLKFAVALGIMLLGLPTYFIWRRRM